MKSSLQILGLVLTTALTAVWDSRAEELNLLGVGRNAALVQTVNPRERRARPVSPHFENLRQMRNGMDAVARLHLFDDATFTLLVDGHRARALDSFSIHGRLREEPSGSFSLVVHKGVLCGVVHCPTRNRVFRIGLAADGSPVVAEMDEVQFGRCGNGPQDAVAPAAKAFLPKAGGAGGAIVCNEEDGSEITVLVLYTDLARAAAGSAQAMEAEVQLAVDTANQCHERSQITPRLRLVHTEEVVYGENGSFDDHLGRLTSPNDGIMDNAHLLRDQVGADLVSLLVTDNDLCGKAWLMTSVSGSFASQGFSIVDRTCASGNFSFAHELGHNMGCAHDQTDTSGGGAYSYSRGWQFTGNSQQSFRTVMAVPAAGGMRIGFFSNPNVNFDGQPTGMAVGQPNEASNAQTINNTASTIANFRRSVVWVDFAYTGSSETGCFAQPYKTMAPAVVAVPAGGIVRVKTGSRQETLSIDKAMKIEAFGGPATIGQ